MPKESSQRVTFVIDSRGWVQERRLDVLAKYLPEYCFDMLTKDRFSRQWNRGKLRGQPVYFASWRIPYRLASSGKYNFRDDDYQYFMASVTSHYNLGGGLDPSKALKVGRNPGKAFDTAVNLLRAFRVVTANSQILYQMLVPHLGNLIYAPNGVDADLFYPPREYSYQPDKIRVGWVGKIKAAKNYQTFEEVQNHLDGNGICFHVVAHPKRVSRWRLLSPAKMLKYYHGLDYYLCTSWHEGTPNPALEAASCGVPVVTTRVGNMPELIEPGVNGFFIEPTVDSILKVFNEIRNLSMEDYRQLSTNIRERVVTGWSWGKQMTNYRTAFDRLIE